MPRRPRCSNRPFARPDSLIEVDESLRFADILSTAAAVANYTRAEEIGASRLIDAIEVLCGRRSMEDLGSPQSPLVAIGRPPASVTLEVQEYVQDWYQRLGSDPHAELSPPLLDEFVAGLRRLLDAD
jgi:hypothetical protein